MSAEDKKDLEKNQYQNIKNELNTASKILEEYDKNEKFTHYKGLIKSLENIKRMLYPNKKLDQTPTNEDIKIINFKTGKLTDYNIIDKSKKEFLRDLKWTYSSQWRLSGKIDFITYGIIKISVEKTTYKYYVIDWYKYNNFNTLDLKELIKNNYFVGNKLDECKEFLYDLYKKRDYRETAIK